MVKRTRRNLSDPRIKRIVKEQMNEGADLSPGTGRFQFHFSPKIAFFLIGIVAIISLGLLFLPVNFPELGQLDAGDEMAISGETNGPAAEPGNPAGITGNTSENQSAGTEQKPDLQPVTRKIQVEILNGCGADGIASQTTQFLRQNNIDVVSMGNYKNFEVKNTLILNRAGNEEKVNSVAELLGIPKNQIKTEKNVGLQLDATIILGADYNQLKPFTKK